MASDPSAAPVEVLRQSIIAAEDLPLWIVTVALAIVAASLVLLVIELRAAARLRASRRRVAWVAVSGVAAAVALAGALLRPHRLRARELSVAPRAVVLLDRSRSMALSSTDKADGVARIDVAERVAEELRGKLGGRVEVMSFGAPAKDGTPLRSESARATASGGGSTLARADGGNSDLGVALRALEARSDDPPSAIVVVSDGRWAAGEVTPRAGSASISGVAIGEGSPPDAAVRSVSFVGAAVAHQPMPLRVEIGCTGGLSCGDLTVTVRELREPESESQGAPSAKPSAAILATGTATVRDGSATIELPVTLERAGTRAIEVAIAAPKGDAIPENDRRRLTVDVARERVRVLHIAGRPTFDVRALRTWLKADAAIDVVSFFILRTKGDDVNAPDEDLALIPFPVRELFTEFLPTFDVVVLQDFDAKEYELLKYAPDLAKYVEHGGGLVHIGGANSFSAGGYAKTPIARVTPVDLLDASNGEPTADSAPFVPSPTPAAKGAALLSDLVGELGDTLPEMAGTAMVGDLRGGGVALWVHPSRTTPSGKPMPVLAIGDVGDGRSVALGVDSSHRLAFSPFAARSGGRAYDAFFRGLLGWLMRDPRYEPVRGRLVHALGAPPCLAGADAAIRLEASPIVGPATLRATVTPLETPNERGGEGFPREVERSLDVAPPTLVPLGVAPEGAFALRLSVAERGSNDRSAAALATRTLGVCERGGEEWADPRPDPARLEALARATGGVVVRPDGLAKLPTPKVARISLERRVTPLLPTWAWAALAACLAGLHWFARRRSGLA